MAKDISYNLKITKFKGKLYFQRKNNGMCESDINYVFDCLKKDIIDKRKIEEVKNKNENNL